MSDRQKTFRDIAYKEALTMLLLVFAGVLLLPIAVYMVGSEVFGPYANIEFGNFYREIHGDLRSGQLVVVFLLLSPYLVWQTIRLSLYFFRRMASDRQQENSEH